MPCAPPHPPSRPPAGPARSLSRHTPRAGPTRRPPPPTASRDAPENAPPPSTRDALVGALAGAVVTAAAFLGFSSTSLTRDQAATVALFERARPAVVFVTALGEARDQFTLDPTEEARGAGSGVVWDAAGHIVTNAHVVRGAADLRVTLSSGNDYVARVVGVDADRDVAVLELGDAAGGDGIKDAVMFNSVYKKQETSAGGDVTTTPTAPRPRLTPMPRAPSKELRVGQTVFAIGAPFGLDHSITAGILSGLDREVPSGITSRPIRMIQHDASLNGGNSGGALLDINGRLLGINTAIFSPTGGSVGIGFALPVDAVAASADQIIATGKVVRPVLGIALAPDAAAGVLGVRGVLVLDARPGGPAAAAGVKGNKRDTDGRLVFGDVIVGFNGATVRSAADLYRALDGAAVGDRVDLALVRGRAKKRSQ